MIFPEGIQVHSDPEELLTLFFNKRQYSKVMVLADRNTAGSCYSLVREHLPAHELIEVAAGEEHKNLETATEIWRKLTTANLDRSSVLFIIGGGVLGDLGGFCASTFKRGIDFVLMPTTLLSQVDASIGGKLGIDFMGYKNHIGVFREPVATLICPLFLKSLPDRELRSGFAEVIKHCLISDAEKWELIRTKGYQEQDWEMLIRHSVAFKTSVVSKDPLEKGLRKILNFGHTIGHALEACSLQTSNRLFHGEAIAAGMIAESFISSELGLMSSGDETEVKTYLRRIYGTTEVPSLAEFMPAIRQDKKNVGKKILMALPDRIGNAVWDIEVSEELVNEALKRLAM